MTCSRSGCRRRRSEVSSPGESAMSTETTYQWLEPKPYKKFTKQLGIKGRNMIVWNLVHSIVVQGHSPEEIARRFDLPLPAVQEALDYYYANQARIDQEVENQARSF